MEQFFKRNNIVITDQVFYHDDSKWQTYLSDKPYNNGPHYFKKCMISALALLKMLSHSKKGVPNEVMGCPRGTCIGDTIIVLDAYPLPVEASETRVYARDEADVFRAAMSEQDSESLGNNFSDIGWYHSHPGYGPWLSGIDVNTTRQNQMMGPAVAIVIDPIRTAISGRVDIGAFRTFTPEQVKQKKQFTSLEGIPEEKIQDYGKHFNDYYALEVEFFVNRTDLPIIEACWDNFWMQYLTNDEMTINENYFNKTLQDMKEKTKKACAEIQRPRDNFIRSNEDNSQLKSIIKFSKEVSQAVTQECVRVIAFK